MMGGFGELAKLTSSSGMSTRTGTCKHAHAHVLTHTHTHSHTLPPAPPCSCDSSLSLLVWNKGGHLTKGIWYRGWLLHFDVHSLSLPLSTLSLPYSLSLIGPGS